ncbi:putative carbonic anhydrase protein [Lasiodiplodia theobromae]|uniref:Carbonic anhydrase n=2 Tax=Lasiodiplodia TaxID=66739 RepID=A0A5N5DA56_9PEZI|nr:Carbonic anhydrase [Lasiodiplodia theobromae]KAB2574280.1 Beta-carbonic anhydrase 1 [Lasiodiplodia theobromae]KAF4543095.1 Carbonic anhydrase [Lasiodiplodia theobromae]KAF9635668.1 putative carbonic anhydrase protein [Lasiodiplodia theobromae]KAK0664901.1 Beta-carbonic anhydrase 1 [Lasiodiplodia hormozganensis]
MTTPIQQNLVEKNKEYAATFTKGHLALPPAKKYAVVTCMDARIDPAAAYGIDLGDAHVIRNAGGSAKDALRSLIISQQLLGTQEIVLIKHTGCGMLTFGNEEAQALVEANLGKEAGEQVKGLDFLAFPDLEEEVRRDVKWLAEQKTIPRQVTVSGWVYEVETGRVRRVE